MKVCLKGVTRTQGKTPRLFFLVDDVISALIRKKRWEIEIALTSIRSKEAYFGDVFCGTSDAFVDIFQVN